MSPPSSSLFAAFLYIEDDRGLRGHLRAAVRMLVESSNSLMYSTAGLATARCVHLCKTLARMQRRDCRAVHHAAHARTLGDIGPNCSVGTSSDTEYAAIRAQTEHIPLFAPISKATKLAAIPPTLRRRPTTGLFWDCESSQSRQIMLQSHSWHLTIDYLTIEPNGSNRGSSVGSQHPVPLEKGLGLGQQHHLPPCSFSSWRRAVLPATEQR
jgi:hypothetical protein